MTIPGSSLEQPYNNGENNKKKAPPIIKGIFISSNSSKNKEVNISRNLLYTLIKKDEGEST